MIDKPKFVNELGLRDIERRVGNDADAEGILDEADQIRL